MVMSKTQERLRRLTKEREKFKKNWEKFSPPSREAAYLAAEKERVKTAKSAFLRFAEAHKIESGKAREMFSRIMEKKMSMPDAVKSVENVFKKRFLTESKIREESPLDFLRKRLRITPMEEVEKRAKVYGEMKPIATTLDMRKKAAIEASKALKETEKKYKIMFSEEESKKLRELLGASVLAQELGKADQVEKIMNRAGVTFSEALKKRGIEL